MEKTFLRLVQQLRLEPSCPCVSAEVCLASTKSCTCALLRWSNDTGVPVLHGFASQEAFLRYCAGLWSPEAFQEPWLCTSTSMPQPALLIVVACEW